MLEAPFHLDAADGNYATRRDISIRGVWPPRHYLLAGSRGSASGGGGGGGASLWKTRGRKGRSLPLAARPAYVAPIHKYHPRISM